MTKRYGQSLTELLSLDFEELEARTAAYVAQLKAATPCPLQEINDELAACSTPTRRQRVKDRTFGMRYGSLSTARNQASTRSYKAAYGSSNMLLVVDDFKLPNLGKVLDDLERDSEEPTVRTNNQSTLS